MLEANVNSISQNCTSSISGSKTLTLRTSQEQLQVEKGQMWDPRKKEEPRHDQNAVSPCLATLTGGSSWVPPEENERLNEVSVDDLPLEVR